MCSSITLLWIAVKCPPLKPTITSVAQEYIFVITAGKCTLIGSQLPGVLHTINTEVDHAFLTSHPSLRKIFCNWNHYTSALQLHSLHGQLPSSESSCGDS